jgi:hypothetical protein
MVFPSPLGENEPPRFSVQGFDKAILFYVSLDPLVASGVALLGPRGSFLRFCALQRAVTFLLYDLPLSAALLVIVGIDSDYQPVPGMPWIALALIAALVVNLIFRLVFAVAASEGKVYLMPGLRWIVARWVPRDPAATGFRPRTAPVPVAGVPLTQPANLPRSAIAKTPLWVWVLFAVAGLPFIAFMGVSAYFAAFGPDIVVQTGANTPERFIATLRDRGLLSRTERPLYFYSNGLFDIEEGLYFLTKEKLVAHSVEWDPPTVIVPFSSIERLSFVETKGYFDNLIVVEYGGGARLEVPVSPEEGGDQRFFQALQALTKRAEQTKGPPTGR